MLRSILFIVLLLTGCSELRVISTAAIRELKADGINVEQIAYNYNRKLIAREKAGFVMTANADSRRPAAGGSFAGEEKKVRLAKVKRVKGLWEKSSL